MKSKITLATILLALFTILANPSVSFAQNQSVSITAAYPIPIGDTFYSRYDGIINTGVKYSRSVSENYSIGGIFDYTRSRYSFGSITAYANFYKFVILASREITIGNGWALNPEAGIGYARISFKSDSQFNNDTNADGFATRLGLKLNKRITSNFSLAVTTSYNLILIDEIGQALDTPYNKELHSINIGLTGIVQL